MITSEIIRKKDFPRGRGYTEKEVDEFLDIIAADLDLLMREAAGLRERIQELTQENERYRGAETTVLSTLEAAKALMTDISASAEKRADIVLKNAEIDAERIRREANESVESMTADAKALQRRWELFSARFRNLLETELDRFDSFTASTLFEEAFSEEPLADTGRRGIIDTVQPSKGSALSQLTGMAPDKTFKLTRS